MSRRALAIFLLACWAAWPASALAAAPLSDAPAPPSGSPAPAVAAKASPGVLAVPAAGSFPALEISAARGQAQAPEDDTLRAMKDEMARSEARLQTADLGKPYFIDYRLLDVEVRSVTADFGSIVDSTTSRQRVMLVEVRMGNYHIDSSNFVASGGFRGSMGNAGQVGIDGDYYSLRQDLWLATDQAYKQAADQLARKQAYLNSQAKPPEIDDFSRIGKPVVLVEPHAQPDWTSRDWNKEAEDASAVFRAYPDFYAGRVTYYMVYQTYYLLTSEGTELRVPSSWAGVEGAVETQAPDGMPLHDFYSDYALTPAGLPPIDQVKQHLTGISQQLEALRAAPAISDYDGPVLFEPQAAGSLLAQALASSLSGANPPLAPAAIYEQLYAVGGRSDWTGRIGQRVFPAGITLYDDPTAQEFDGQPLIGGYQVDAEGVPGRRVAIVNNGMLVGLLMSRRPGPDFSQSNGHGRAGGLGAPTPSLSNLFLTSSDALDAQAMKQKLIAICKSDGLPWCLVVKRMDNPALAAIHHDDFEEMLRDMVSGISNGDRAPLAVERVWVNDGHEELVRGARIIGLGVNNLRNNLAAVGSDPAVVNFMQNPQFAATALAAFGSAAGGLPSSVVTPSLLIRDVQVNGPHGGEQRLPLIPIPPMQ